MGLFQEIRDRARHVVGPVLGLCAVGYFAYHVVHGERGLIAWWNIKQRVAAAEAVLDTVHAERERLEIPDEDASNTASTSWSRAAWTRTCSRNGRG